MDRHALFLSYAREDRAIAEQLAQALQAAGHRVWWDREIRGGQDFTAEIERELHAADAVLVLWSADSVRSTFVRDEAARARDAGKLLPLRIAEVVLPVGFGQIHTLDLIDWEGEVADEAYQALLHALHDGSRALPPPRRLLPQRRSVQLMALVLVLALLAALLYTRHEASLARERAAAIDLARKQRADDEVLRGLAQAFAREPNPELARNHYRAALENYPSHGRAAYYLGHLYASEARLALAAEMFMLATKRPPDWLDSEQRRQAEALIASVGERDAHAPFAPTGQEPSASETVASAAKPRPAASTASVASVASVASGAGEGAGAPPAAAPAPPPPTLGKENPASGIDPDALQAPHILAPPAEAPRAPALAAPQAPIPSPTQPAALPHVPPSVAQAKVLQRQVAALFAPTREQRIAATTALILDPAQLSDALAPALAMARTLQAREGLAGAELERTRSGVINVLALLKQASPVALRKNAESIADLLAAVAANGAQTRAAAREVGERLAAARTAQPQTWILIAEDAQGALAARIRQRLLNSGYRVAVERVAPGRAPAQAELRALSASDAGLLRWQARLLAQLGVRELRQSVLKHARAKVDTYEIWLSIEQCKPGAESVCAEP